MSGYGQGGGGFGQPPGGGGGYGQPPGGGGYGGPPAGGVPPGGGGGFGQPPQGAAPGGEAPLARIPFTPEDEANIASMARFMFLAGALAFAVAVFNIILSAAQGIVSNAPGASIAGQVCGGVLGAAISGVLAFLLIQGSKAFKQVVTSDVADQAYLAEGLAKLKIYFMVKGILFILAIVAICCIITVGMFAAAAMLESFGR